MADYLSGEYNYYDNRCNPKKTKLNIDIFNLELRAREDFSWALFFYILSTVLKED